MTLTAPSRGRGCRQNQSLGRSTSANPAFRSQKRRDREVSPLVIFHRYTYTGIRRPWPSPSLQEGTWERFPCRVKGAESAVRKPHSSTVENKRRCPKGHLLLSCFGLSDPDRIMSGLSDRAGQGRSDRLTGQIGQGRGGQIRQGVHQSSSTSSYRWLPMPSCSA